MRYLFTYLVAFVAGSTANAEDLKSFEPNKVFYVSPDASNADCETSIHVQLTSDSPSFEFLPDADACRTGRRFVGSTLDDGRVHITLRPGKDRNGSFAASVTDDGTGSVHTVVPDANGDMVVKERVRGWGLEGRVLVETSTTEAVLTSEEAEVAAVEAGDDQSHLHARKLWDIIKVEIGEHDPNEKFGSKVTVEWECKKNRKDWISINGGKYVKKKTGGGGTCSHTYYRECNKTYEVRVKKCWWCKAKTRKFTTGACGCTDQECPFGIRDDGYKIKGILVGNTVSGYCIWGSPPGCFRRGTESTAFIFNDMYYHKAFWDQCFPPMCPEFQVTSTQNITTNQDGNGNCLVGEAPAGTTPFVYNDRFYYTATEKPFLSYKPKISYWSGKVNQRSVNDVWMTDPDGTSGANIDMLVYCQKFWPDTISVALLPDRETITFQAGGNTGAHVSTRNVFECVQDLPRISYWSGKVNQRNVNGVWMTDLDGTSGANIDKLVYCQKFWPKTIRVSQLPYRETITFQAGGNTGAHVSTRDVFVCVQPECTYLPFLESRYDGANCMVAKIPDRNTGWIEGQKYYAIPEKVCHYTDQGTRSWGFYDTRNCFMDDNVSADMNKHVTDNKWTYDPCPLEKITRLAFRSSVEDICSSSVCADAQEVSNEAYESVSLRARSEISSGAYSDESDADVDSLLAESVSSGDYTEVVSPLLSLLSKWYSDQTADTCKNDGNEPVHWKTNGWLLSSLDECCEQHFSWDINTCMSKGLLSSPEELGLGLGYYFDSGSGKCLEGTPDASTSHDTIDACCEANSSVDYAYCISRSSDDYTDGWLVSWKESLCVQDCDPGAGGTPCSPTEHQDPYLKIFETPEQCCEETLSWIDSERCIAASSGTPPAPVYTDKFYVDWHGMKCSKDCDDQKNGLPCMGSPPASSGFPTQFFLTAEACCEGKLHWIDIDNCVADTNGVPSQAQTQGSEEWFVDWNVNYGTCVKDCIGSAPCGGLKENWEHGYASASNCCASISWQPVDSCHL